jgi:hypothetical protein
MPKKAKVTELPLQAEDSDDQLESQPQIQSQPLEKDLITFDDPKPKKKRNISEEQKQVLRERLKLAHAKKAELAEARRKVKEEEEQNHLAQKQLAILEQARLIKQRQKKEIETITNVPSLTNVPNIVPQKQSTKSTVVNNGAKGTGFTSLKKKQPKIKYVIEESESEEEEEEEEEEVVVVKKKTLQKQQPQQQPQPKEQVYQQPQQQPQFKIKFY